MNPKKRISSPEPSNSKENHEETDHKKQKLEPEPSTSKKKYKKTKHKKQNLHDPEPSTSKEKHKKTKHKMQKLNEPESSTGKKKHKKIKHKKRKLDEPEPSISKEIHKKTKDKKRELEPTPSTSMGKHKETSPNILHLPDELLLRIMNYLKRKDLEQLRLCCRKLATIAKDRSLWSVDFRGKLAYGAQLPYIATHSIHPLLFSFAMRGDLKLGRKESYIPFGAVRNMRKCWRIKEMIFENYYIDDVKKNINFFPRTLETLSLEGCVPVPEYVSSNYKLFRQINIRVPNLRCLILTRLCWPLSDIIKDISSLNHLTELRLNSCLRILPCDITQINFQKLEILDLRDTAVPESLVRKFCQCRTLKQLYLDCPKYLRNEISYEVLEDLQNLLRSRAALVSSELGYVKKITEDRWLEQLCKRIEMSFVTNNMKKTIRWRNNRFSTYIYIDLAIVRCNNLETLNFKHYSYVTSNIMKYLLLTLPKLKYLDITGSSLSLKDIERFHSERPNNVKVESSFGTYGS